MLLKVCLNGARLPREHPVLSAQPQQVAHELAAAIAAGAHAVHLHAKDSSGQDSLESADVSRFLKAARAASASTPLGLTTGAWALPEVSDRVAAIAGWQELPDFASLNWHEPGAERVAAALAQRGIGIEAGIWHEEGLEAWQSSPYRGKCMRALVEIPDMPDPERIRATALTLVEGIRAVEPGLPILLHGEGGSTWPAFDLAVQWGLDARIGLEDTLNLPDGRMAASNAELVQAAIARSERLK